MSSVSFGKVVQLEQTDGGYHKFVIRTQTPFDFKYLRFCVWKTKILNIDGKRVEPGEDVKVVYEREKFLKLKSIERSSHLTCEFCEAFCEKDDIIESPVVGSGPWVSRLRQRTYRTCQQCNNIPENDRRASVHTALKLIGKSEKQYTYSHGIRLTFVDDTDEDNKEFYFVIVYENDPIYLEVKEYLKLKLNYLIHGWILSKNDDGCVMKVVEIDDPR